jgi:hypothetical protein
VTADTAIDTIAEIDDPAIAFEAIARKLAGLTAAVEGFAARQQELHARDYGPDLAKVLDQHQQVWKALLTLDKRPAMALTPRDIAAQIEAAATMVREADHPALLAAEHRIDNAVQTLGQITASALSAKKQRYWIASVAAAALVIGFAFGTIIPSRLAQAAPESWHWPEARAAAELNRNGWEAGVRLLQVSSPRRLQALTDAAQLSIDNAGALTDCRSRAGNAADSVTCRVTVRRALPSGE